MLHNTEAQYIPIISAKHHNDPETAVLCDCAPCVIPCWVVSASV